LILFFIVAAGGAAAQVGSSPLADTGQPVVIEADDGIEWRQKDRTYVARGNARAMRGDVSVRAETLTAHYREGAAGKQEIWKVIAEGGVVISSKSQTISGERGVYTIDDGKFVLTGGPLRLETPDELVTARDKLEYRSHDQIAVISGDAVAVRGDKRIRADQFTARFAENATGELNLQRVDATGDVTITTPTEIARAERGVYNAATGVATLSGSVKLTRGDNQMNGAFAEVNLNTGVSRLTSGPGSGGRVRGLFVPGQGGDMQLQVPGINTKTKSDGK